LPFQLITNEAWETGWITRSPSLVGTVLPVNNCAFTVLESVTIASKENRENLIFIKLPQYIEIQAIELVITNQNY